MLITLVPLILLQMINIHTNFNRNIKQKFNASEDVAGIVSKSFVNFIDELWVQELIIGRSIINNSSDVKQIQAYLESVANTDENVIRRAAWSNPEGVMLANSDKTLIGKTITDRDYYYKILNGQDKILSDLVIGYSEGEMVLPVSRAVRKDGKLLGIIIFVIDIDKLVSRIPTLELSKDDLLCIVDSKGRMVYHNLNNSIPYEERMIPFNAPGWKALKGEIVKSENQYTPFDGIYRLGVDFPIKEFGWVCTYKSSRAIVLKDTYTQAMHSTVILLIVSITSLGAAFQIGRKIAEPLIILKTKANELKEGNYTVRTNISGNDEIAATAEAFDMMADSVEQYDKLKSQFFSNLSHELKTPINVIYSSVQLMESYDKSINNLCNCDKCIKNIKIIKQNCFRLMRLIGNLIDVSKYDSGYLKINLHNCNIVSLIEDISLSVVKYAEQKNVTIVFDTDVEEKIISCDPDSIERIILNLISNALKFTEPGGYIFITLYDSSDKITIVVKDTGIGIPKDKLDIIFDRFRQVDSSLNRNQEGSGLGLSIVKYLVETHGGNISVKSKISEGTEFSIELPATLFPSVMEDKNKTDKYRDTVQKIEIEFSDIYSIQNE